MGTVIGVVSTPVTWICVFFCCFCLRIRFLWDEIFTIKPHLLGEALLFHFFQASYDANPRWNGVFEKSLRGIVLFSHVPAHTGNHLPKSYPASRSFLGCMLVGLPQKQSCLWCLPWSSDGFPSSRVCFTPKNRPFSWAAIISMCCFEYLPQIR